MKNNISIWLKTFLFSITLIGSSYGLFAQDVYYWSNGKKIELKEDKSSIVIYEKENQKLSLVKSSSIKEVKENSNKRLGNYKVIKFTETPAKSVFDESKIRFKRSALVSEHGDILFPTQFILLKLKNESNLVDLDNIFQQYNITYHSAVYNVVILKVKNIDDVFDAANSIYMTGLATWCRPNFLREMQQHSDPMDKQYYLHNKYHYCNAFGKDINVVKAWEISKGCENIRVAVLDDGVEDHPDLRDNNGNSRVVNGYSVPGVTANGRPAADAKHGQCVAGIIAATHSVNVRGIAPNITIVPVNLGFDIQDEIEWFIAMNWAWEPDGGNADVLSNSWGPKNDASGHELYIEAINNAQIYGRGGDYENSIPGLGAIVVFSSGNNSLNEVSDYAKAAIAVGALNKYDAPAELKYKIASDKRYTNIGPNLDLMAYGGDVDCDIWRSDCLGDIRTIDRVGSNGYSSGEYFDNFSGTSAACPQVSGAAALILSVNPNLSREEVETILFTTATDLGSIGKDNTYGYGKLNVYAALHEAVETIGKHFELSEGYLSYSKIYDNFKTSFVGSPGCGIASGVYWCDIYKAEVTLPPTSAFLYEGDGLSGGNPNTGEYYVNITNDGSSLKASTFFYYVRTNVSQQTINKWVPYNPSNSWTRKYSTSPSENITFNGIVNAGQSMKVYATNSIRLTDGFKANNGSNFESFLTVSPGELQCFPNPSGSMILKSATINNEISSDEDKMGLLEVHSNNKLIIYPNPSDGNFSVSLNREIEKDANIEIFNLYGRLIYKSRIHHDNQNIQFTSVPGVYLIKIYNGSEFFTSKIILN